MIRVHSCVLRTALLIAHPRHARSAFGMADRSAELERALHQLVPPLDSSGHKGQSGKIGVVGGSLEYTGGALAVRIGAPLKGSLEPRICTSCRALGLSRFDPPPGAVSCPFRSALLRSNLCAQGGR